MNQPSRDLPPRQQRRLSPRIAASIFGGGVFGFSVGAFIVELLSSGLVNTLYAAAGGAGLGLGLMLAAKWFPEG